MRSMSLCRFTSLISLLAVVRSAGAQQVRFTSSKINELNASVAAIEIRGARLPEPVLVFSGVEAPPKK